MTPETLRANFAVSDTVFYYYKERIEHSYYQSYEKTREGYGYIQKIDYENLIVEIVKVDANIKMESETVIFDFKKPGEPEKLLKKGFRPGQVVEFKDVCQIASVNGDEITLTNGKTFNRRNLKQVEDS